MIRIMITMMTVMIMLMMIIHAFAAADMTCRPTCSGRSGDRYFGCKNECNRSGHCDETDQVLRFFRFFLFFSS